MANTLKIYTTTGGLHLPDWKLLPSSLFIVEDINSYLSAYDTADIITFTDIQYIKNDLEIGVNLDLSQSYSQPSIKNFCYVSIHNHNEAKTYYYFVKKVVWRSKHCIRLELIMDVLNTFKEGNDYQFKGNTRIIREHKDRFKKVYRRFDKLKLNVANYIGSVGTAPEVNDYVHLWPSGLFSDTGISGTLTAMESDYLTILIDWDHTSIEQDEILAVIEEYKSYPFCVGTDEENYGALMVTASNSAEWLPSGTPTLYRNIDYVNEGINPILIHKDKGANIKANDSTLRQDWYLLYRNQNDPSDSLVNPVDCYLIPKEAIEVNAAVISSGRIIPSFIEEGKYYYFSIPHDESYTLSNGVTWTASNNFTGYRILITKAGGKLAASLIETYQSGGNNYCEIHDSYDDLLYITANNLPAHYCIKDSFVAATYNNIIALTYPETFDDSSEPNYIDGISNLDRVSAKNIKLIKLPYCPYNFSILGGVLQVDGNADWEYVEFAQDVGGDMHALKLINLNKKLHSEINVTSEHPFYDLIIGGFNMANIVATKKRMTIANSGYEMESKIFHSDFYRPTYVYDSFSFYIQLEKCQSSYYEANNIRVEKANINFDVTSTINSRFMFTYASYRIDKAEQNYYNVMPIARNNEEVLYNVPYINYVRTGYNYDVKSKNISLASNIAGLGLSATSMAVSLALPSAPLKVAGVVGSLVSMAMSIKSTIVTSIQNEDSIRQKITQTQNQATSVAGSDDVDLMSIYAENRLRYMVYGTTDLMRGLLEDLFFYAGYSTNKLGVPTHNNRSNFDYLECEASLLCENTIPDDCKQELINCFKNGVTYIHKNTGRSGLLQWDLAQEYENWENSLLS